MKVFQTNSATTPVTYKCGMMCPPLSQESTVSSQQVCTRCSTTTATPVFDMSTKTCIADATACPANTVKTTLDKLIKDDSNLGSAASTDASTIKVCAMCNPRCKTCSPSDPNMCMTCASTLMTNTITTTMNGTTTTKVECTKTCMAGKFPDANNNCVND